MKEMKNKKILLYNCICVCLVFIMFLTCVYQVKNKQLKKVNNERNAFIHFSIDDCIDLFYDLNNSNYESVFENDLLKYLKKLNSEFGCKFSLFVFGRNEKFDLEDCTDRYRDEFVKNSEWLKFGFHAISGNSNYDEQNNIVNDYNYVIDNLNRIVGSESITETIRIEKFLLNEENAKKLCDNNITINLLGADSENRKDYFLSEEQNKKLFQQEYLYDDNTGITFYNTDIRIENIKLFEIDKILDESNDKNLIIFTHEWMFYGRKNRIFTKLKIEQICKYAKKRGYKFDYPYIN